MRQSLDGSRPEDRVRKCDDTTWIFLTTPSFTRPSTADTFLAFSILECCYMLARDTSYYLEGSDLGKRNESRK